MLDLDTIKVALFDFDDTLCIHTTRPMSRALSQEEQSEATLSGGNPWPCGVAPQVMQRFVAMCHARAIHLGLLSAVTTFTRSQAKVDWVTSRYGVVMKNYCVGPDVPKTFVMKELARHYSLQPDQILFVDDYWANLDSAVNEGFAACSPMECVYYLELYEK